MYDPELYRDKAEVEQWKKRDPIAAFAARLQDVGLLDDDDLGTIERRVAREIDDGGRLRRGGHLGAGRGPDAVRVQPNGRQMSAATARPSRRPIREAMREAIRDALHATIRASS